MDNHLFVIFAVLDVSFTVNSCLNCSFFYIYINNKYLLTVSDFYGGMLLACIGYIEDVSCWFNIHYLVLLRLM